MSFCRFGADSDVYCFYHTEGYYEVWSCGEDYYFETAQETIAFLRKIKEEGEKVPDYVFKELEEAKP